MFWVPVVFLSISLCYSPGYLLNRFQLNLLESQDMDQKSSDYSVVTLVAGLRDGNVGPD